MSGAVVKLAPGFSHRKAARAAIEQARTEFLLDPADGLRHCRFGHPKLVSGTDKGACLDDFRKDRQPLKIWKFRHFDFRNNGEMFLYIIPLAAVDELVSKLISASLTPSHRLPFQLGFLQYDLRPSRKCAFLPK